jgi:hypothetical protein
MYGQGTWFTRLVSRLQVRPGKVIGKRNECDGVGVLVYVYDQIEVTLDCVRMQLASLMTAETYLVGLVHSGSSILEGFG